MPENSRRCRRHPITRLAPCPTPPPAAACAAPGAPSGELTTITGCDLRPLPGHRSRRGGRVLRDPVPAAADLRSGRRHRLRRRVLRRGVRPGFPRPGPAALPRRPSPTITVTTSSSPPSTTCWPGRRFEIISIGFVIALWSGSRALNVLRRHHHDHVRAGRPARPRADPGPVLRALPGLPGGRRRSCCRWCWPARPCVDRLLLPTGLDFLGDLYWPVVLVGTVGFLATLYHVAVPVRTRWRADLPGRRPDLADLARRAAALLRVVLSAVRRHADDLRPAGRADRRADLALPHLDSRSSIGAAFNAAVDDRLSRASPVSSSPSSADVHNSGHGSHHCENQICSSRAR